MNLILHNFNILIIFLFLLYSSDFNNNVFTIVEGNELENYQNYNFDEKPKISLKYSVELFEIKFVKNLLYIKCDKELNQLDQMLLKEFLKKNFYVQIYHENLKSFQINRNFKTGYLINCQNSSGDLKKIKNFLSWSEKYNLFKPFNFWLIYLNQFDAIYKIFDNTFIIPDSDVKIIIKNNDENKLQFYDIYKITKYDELNIELISDRITCSDEILQAMQGHSMSVWMKRKNLHGIKIFCGVVIEFPDVFVNFEDVKTRHLNTIAKINYPVTTNLRQDLNFSFNLYQYDSYGWYHNGTFDGMMGGFQQNKIEFGVNALFMRLDRVAVVDFVAETFNIRACTIFRQPSLSAVSNIFILPFGLDVWLSVFALAITAATLLIIQNKFSPIKLECEALDCALFVIGAICQQGFYVEVISRSARWLVFTIFLSTLFLFTSFSANIVALLQSPSNAIKSVNDLVLSPLQMGVQDVKYNKVYLKEINDPVLQNLYKKKIQIKGDLAFMRPYEGMKRVRNGFFAYQIESQAAYQIISDTFNENEKCGLKELELFQLPVMSIPVSKNFPYKELFRQRLRWQRENGLLNREFRKWLPAKPICAGGSGGFVSIGLKESRYPFIWFLSGLLLAIVVCAFENMIKKIKIRRF